MKLLLDTASLSDIKSFSSYFVIDGVTTNPSILKKEGKDPYLVLEGIKKFLKDKELHVQVVGNTAGEMIKEADTIHSRLGKDVYIKIPSNKEGFKAMKELGLYGRKENVTATGIYTPVQAYLASKNGARYTAVYVNRIDNLGYDGIETCREIQEIFNRENENSYKIGLLGASFKNTRQVLELCKMGAESVTVSSEMMNSFLKNREVDAAILDFKKDFESLVGKDKDMSNI